MSLPHSGCALLFSAAALFALPPTLFAQGGFRDGVTGTAHNLVDLIDYGSREGQARSDIRHLHNALNQVLHVLEGQGHGQQGSMQKGMKNAINGGPNVNQRTALNQPSGTATKNATRAANTIGARAGNLAANNGKLNAAGNTAVAANGIARLPGNNLAKNAPANNRAVLNGANAALPRNQATNKIQNIGAVRNNAGNNLAVNNLQNVGIVRNVAANNSAARNAANLAGNRMPTNLGTNSLAFASAGARVGSNAGNAKACAHANTFARGGNNSAQNLANVRNNNSALANNLTNNSRAANISNYSANNLARNFPNLSNFQVLDATGKNYNCIAATLGINNQWINPKTGPANAPLAYMDQLYGANGYKRMPTMNLSSNGKTQKVAVYATTSSNGSINQITHAALQQPNGAWTSKLGSLPLIQHASPYAVAGGIYGMPVATYARPLAGNTVGRQTALRTPTNNFRR